MKQRQSKQAMVLLQNHGGVWTLETLLQRTTSEGECQLWARGKATYGNVWHRNRAWRAHRLSYHLATGNEVHDVRVRRSCANALCINPDHLVPVSRVEEVRKPGDPACSAAGCDSPVHARSLCESHYQKAYRRGELASAPYVPRLGSWTIEKVLANCDRVGSCFVWKSSSTRGYPDLRHNGVAMKVHRFVYQMSTGDQHIAGAQIHHTCANSRCVNPEHLQRACKADNVLEMLSRRDYEALIAALQAQVQELEAR